MASISDALVAERVIAVTSCPPATSIGTRRRPITPVAPATKILMACCFRELVLIPGYSLSALCPSVKDRTRHEARRRGRVGSALLPPAGGPSQGRRPARDEARRVPRRPAG